MATLAGLTIEDFEKLPEALARNHELVDGELIDVSGNVPEHNWLRDLLGRILGNFVDEHQLGNLIAEQEYDFGGNGHGPDLSFVKQSKVHLFDRKRRVQPFVPDLAIEIVSESDGFNSLMKKAKRYCDSGTQEVWIFSMDMRQAVRYSGEQGVILGGTAEFASDLIPGFSLRLSELFDRI